jgi:hypothetical protein
MRFNRRFSPTIAKMHQSALNAAWKASSEMMKPIA